MARRLAALTLAGLLVCLLGACGGGAGFARYAGQRLDHAPPAPDLQGRAASGRRVQLSRLRGRAVLLTFAYTRCPDACPLIVSKLAAALDRLSAADAARVQVIAVSVDPRGDNPERVRRFVRERGMAGRMEYVVGSRDELAPIWRAYGIAVGGSPRDRLIGHSLTVRGITADGRQRTLYGTDFTPRDVAHDIPLLASG